MARIANADSNSFGVLIRALIPSFLRVRALTARFLAAALILVFQSVRSVAPAAALGADAAPLPEPAAGTVRSFTLRPGVSMDFVWIPSGKFEMGSRAQDVPGGPLAAHHGAGFMVETPMHPVTFSHGFWLGRYEVTQAQWQAVMGKNPSKFKNDSRLPVDNVSWNHAQQFIKILNRGDTGPFRLPTEAEWEYACRAGTTTRFYTGDCITTDQANFNGHAQWKGCERGIFRMRPVPVGIFPPNPWGLHDMLGNVWEWCQDNWHRDFNNAPEDGRAWPDGNLSWKEKRERVLRGGAYDLGSGWLSTTLREGVGAGFVDETQGVRLARNP